MPPNWQEFSQENLRHSNQERETSMRLRGVIGQTLSQTSQDMREQADRCEEALSRRVSETEEATRGLEDQLNEKKFLLTSFSPTHNSYQVTDAVWSAHRAQVALQSQQARLPCCHPCWRPLARPALAKRAC